MMRGETNPDNEPGTEEQGATAAGGRRPSVEALQNILKRVSKSPFQNQYQFVPRAGELLTDPSSPAAASGVTDRHPSQPHRGRESSGDGPAMEDVGRRTSEGLNSDAIFVPEVTTVQKAAEISELPKDPYEAFTLNPMQNPFQAPPLATNKPTNGYLHDVTSDTPDLFWPISAQPRSRSKPLPLKSAGLLQEEVANLFQATNEEDLLQADRTRKLNPFDQSPMVLDDPFKSPLNQDDELFKSSRQKAANPFYTAPPREVNGSPAVPGGEIASISEDKRNPFIKEDIFGMFTFSSSSTNTADPFPSPLSGDLFQDFSSLDDPFGTTPSSHFVPFQDVSPETPDIFKPLPLKPNERDVFGMMSGNTAPKPTYSTPLINSPFDMKPDMPSPLDLFTDSQSSPAIEAKFADGPHNILLTTPQGTQHDVLQQSPFSRARYRPVVRSQSSAEMTHVQTIKRPPKPLPRSRAPKTENPIEPEATAPKVPPKPSFRPALWPISPPKPQTPETKLMESAHPYESILLTGQEMCVEDWPDDSPQLNPDFKPAGSLRLRRDSLKLEAVSEGSGDDQEGSLKKKDRKFRLSQLSRKGSKEKFPKEAKSRSLPTFGKPSKEYFSEENEVEQNEVVSKKTSLKTRGSKLRSASFTSSMLMGKHGNGGLPQDSQQGDDLDKKNIRQWSEGKVLDASPGEEEEEDEEEEEMDRYGTKTKKKMKIRFVPKRGFSIVMEKEASGYRPRKDSKDKSQEEVLGAHGYTPRKKSQDDVFEGGKERIHSLLSTSKEDMLDLQTQKRSYSADDLYNKAPMEDCKQTKESKVKAFMKPMSKNKARPPEWVDPPGAASSDLLSEAAAAEWQAAQMDEHALDGLEEECEDGDTDSLMEWWNTVEQWDEVPSDDEEKVLQEDESKSFTILADKVHRGLRVFNKVFTERAEALWQFVIALHTIADNINEFHQKARIAGITGGTTTAVGGVTVIAGLALAPLTLGASLLVTAVGVGVATAGGIASASAALSDNVNNVKDRKKVEIVLQDYEAHLKTIGKILHFVNTGLYKLRGHPFLRSGTRHYSKDWETRRAVQMISLVDSPVMKGTQLTDAALASIQELFKGLDMYFLKDSKELRKGHKKEAVMQIKEVANALNEGIVELNAIREELQDATGNI